MTCCRANSCPFTLGHRERLLLNTTRPVIGGPDGSGDAAAGPREKNDRDFRPDAWQVGRPDRNPYSGDSVFLALSDLRDSGRPCFGDEYCNPRHYIRKPAMSITGLWLVRAIDTRPARACWTPRVRSTSAYDPVTSLPGANVYLQAPRTSKVKRRGSHWTKEAAREAEKLLEESGEDPQMPEGASRPPRAPARRHWT